MKTYKLIIRVSIRAETYNDALAKALCEMMKTYLSASISQDCEEKLEDPLDSLTNIVEKYYQLIDGKNNDPGKQDPSSGS